MAALGSRDVILHVYDLHDCNSWLRGVALGVYHTGVEVGGKEYSFSEQGIVKCDPKRAPKPAVFRESIVLGECQDLSGLARKALAWGGRDASQYLANS